MNDGYPTKRPSAKIMARLREEAEGGDEESAAILQAIAAHERTLSSGVTVSERRARTPDPWMLVIEGPGWSSGDARDLLHDLCSCYVCCTASRC